MMRNLNFIANEAYRFKIVFEKEDGSFHAFYFDAQSSEQVEKGVEITSHPTTIGRNITDNAYPTPITISVGVRVAYVESRNRPQGENLTWFGNRKEAIDALENLRLNNNVCTIYTRHTLYENMVLSSVGHSNTGRNQLNLDIMLEFQEIRFNEYQDFVVTEEDVAFGVNSDSPLDGSIESEVNRQGKIAETAGTVATGGALVGASIFAISAIKGAKSGAIAGAKAGLIGGVKGAFIGALAGAVIGVVTGVLITKESG